MSLPLPDNVWCQLSTVGTGNTLTVSGAVPGYRVPPSSFSGQDMPYTILDGQAWETGHDPWTLTNGIWTLTRNMRESSTGALLNLSGSATIMITPGGVDLQQLASPPPTRLTANTTLALGQSYKGAASALVLTLPASPGEGGLPISYVGVNGDEATNPPTFLTTGSDAIYVAGVTDATPNTLPQSNFPVEFIPRAGGWDAI